MRDYIKQAIQLINQYADILKEWIEDSDFHDLPNDVHQLQPTKNDLKLLNGLVSLKTYYL